MLTKLVAENLDIVYFVYGLSYVVMGISILIHHRRESIFRLADIIWLLAAFGLIHGLNEWFDMFAIIRGGHSDLFDTIRTAVLIVSFIFLLEFSRRLVSLSYKQFLNKWTCIILYFSVIVLVCVFKNERSIWPRYLLGLPGGLFTALGFIFYYNTNKAILKPIGLYR
jgi:hypothetical protein